MSRNSTVVLINRGSVLIQNEIVRLAKTPIHTCVSSIAAKADRTNYFCFRCHPNM